MSGPIGSETYSCVVDSHVVAGVINHLIDNRAWFEATPAPRGGWIIEVQNEARMIALLEITNMREMSKHEWE